MILSARTFTKEWIKAQARAFGAPQAEIFERCVHALELVGCLAEAELDFIFKGGTSLILHLEPVRRLSVDVDIACLEPLERVRNVLDQVVEPQAPFTRWQHQDWRDAENPPTKFFSVYYPALTGSPGERHIQLDVLVETSPYADVENRTVQTSFIEVENPVTVKIPSINCLLGDKLAAFAPSTIGVLYQPYARKTGEIIEPKPLRVIKQMFDVSELFMKADNLQTAGETYHKIFAAQNGYRGGRFTIEQALEDTLDAAYWLSQMNLHPLEKNDKTEFFRQGIQGLSNHLIGTNFTLAKAQVAASRAAIVASAIRAGKQTGAIADMRIIPTDPDVLKALQIEGARKKLHKLGKANVEAFYNWHQVDRLLS